MSDDDPGVLHADQRQEEPDAAADGPVKIARDGVNDRLLYPGKGKREENQPRDEHRPQRRLPRDAHADDHGVGEVGVDAHARRQRNRVSRIDPHQQATERRGETRGDRDGGGGHAGFAQDRGVDEDDVRHRQEGRYPGQGFGLPVGAELVEAEVAFGLAEKVHAVSGRRVLRALIVVCGFVIRERDASSGAGVLFQNRGGAGRTRAERRSARTGVRHVGSRPCELAK